MALLRLHREVLRTQGSLDNATYLSLIPSMTGTLRVSFYLILTTNYWEQHYYHVTYSLRL